MGGWCRWALVSPDGVAPSRMVSVSASVNLPLHHKVQMFSSGTGSPGLSRKKGYKTIVCVCLVEQLMSFNAEVVDLMLYTAIDYQSVSHVSKPTPSPGNCQSCHQANTLTWYLSSSQRNICSSAIVFLMTELESSDQDGNDTMVSFSTCTSLAAASTSATVSSPPLSSADFQSRWLVVMALDLQLNGWEFNSLPLRCRVTTLCKLFTPTCLGRSQWFGVGMIDWGVRGRGQLYLIIITLTISNAP